MVPGRQQNAKGMLGCVTKLIAKFLTCASFCSSKGNRLSSVRGVDPSSVRITRDSDIGLEFLRRRCCWPEVALWEIKLKPQSPASRKPAGRGSRDLHGPCARQRRVPGDRAEWACRGQMTQSRLIRIYRSNGT